MIKHSTKQAFSTFRTKSKGPYLDIPPMMKRFSFEFDEDDMMFHRIDNKRPYGPLSCRKCDRSFRTNIGLERHMREYHGGES